MIYVPANSSDGMIYHLNTIGINATDCSVSALPQIYTVIGMDGKKVHNLVIDNETSYIFERQDEGIFKIIAVNPSQEMKEKCSNVYGSISTKYTFESDSKNEIPKKESYVFIYSIIILALILLSIAIKVCMGWNNG